MKNTSFYRRWVRSAACVAALGVFAASASAVESGPQADSDVPAIHIADVQNAAPLLLDQNADYLLENVRITGMTDTAAMTLTGSINSVTLRHCQLGQVTAGPDHRAAALQAAGASVRNFTASDSEFVNAENQLLSLRDGAFGTVTIEHCVFRNSDQFLKRIYANDPIRTAPPVTEFYNIDHLELLDNQFENTTIIIHSSVKVVVLRGADLSHVQVESPDTQVLRIDTNDLMTPDSAFACNETCTPTPSDAKEEKGMLPLLAMLIP